MGYEWRQVRGTRRQAGGADRLKTGSLEQLRDFYDRRHVDVTRENIRPSFWCVFSGASVQIMPAPAACKGGREIFAELEPRPATRIWAAGIRSAHELASSSNVPCEPRAV